MGNYLNKIIAIFLIFSFLGLFLIFSLFWYFSNDLPDFGFLKTYKPPVSTKVYDIEGDVIADFSREKRSFIEIDQVPKRVISAFLSAEDKNFYEHSGIDAIGITRAVVKNIQNIISGKRLEGASTITQQVAKNFLLSSDVSLARKVKEAILAFRIEKVLSKKRILELYLNEIYLGERSYGIASASMTYFDKSIKDINNAEAALLASLPKAPSKYNPYRNFNSVKGRKDWVLKRMQDNGFISEEELKQSLSYKIKLKKRDLDIDTSPAFFIEEVRKNLIDQYGEQKLYRQGLFVKTSLNKKVQEVASSALNKNLILYSKRHGWTGPLYKNYSVEKFNNLGCSIFATGTNEEKLEEFFRKYRDTNQFHIFRSIAEVEDCCRKLENDIPYEVPEKIVATEHKQIIRDIFSIGFNDCNNFTAQKIMEIHKNKFEAEAKNEIISTNDKTENKKQETEKPKKKRGRPRKNKAKAKE